MFGAICHVRRAVNIQYMPASPLVPFNFLGLYPLYTTNYTCSTYTGSCRTKKVSSQLSGSEVEHNEVNCGYFRAMKSTASSCER